jgi:AcrR family transcriptional regulator
MNTHWPRSRLLRSPRLLRRADKIVDAAASVFAERGYHGTSTQAIADVLGLRQASLYYYFPSKEAALELVCDKGVDGFVERAERIVAGEGAALGKLAQLIQSHLSANHARRDYVKVFINERRYLADAARRRIGRKGRRIERCFEDVIRAGIDEGSIRPDVDARLAMLAVLGMLNSVINWRRDDQPEDVGRLAAELGKLAVGSLARPAAPALRRRAGAG